MNERAATHAYRLRRAAGFDADAFAAFETACRLFQARVRSIETEWYHLALTRHARRPDVAFFPPVLSADRAIASQPMWIDGVTLDSRALFRDLARDLYQFLPVPLILEVEFGVVEPSVTGSGLDEEWWDPHARR